MILAGLVIARRRGRRRRDHRRREHLAAPAPDAATGPAGSRRAIILDASLEVRSAIFYATLINVLAVVPVFFLQGVTGSFFEPLAFSYALAILASMVVALTVTPALALHPAVQGAASSAATPRSCAWLKRGYGAALSAGHRAGRARLRGGRRPRAWPAWSPRRASGETLYPAFKERDFLMHWITAPGTSTPEEQRIVTQASRELRTIPGVRNFGSHIGQAFLAEEIVGSNFGENWVSVDRNADYDKTLAAIEEVVDGYPGLYHDVQTYLRERIDEVLTGAARADRGAHLRPGPDDAARARPTGRGGAVGHRRPRRPAHRAAGRRAADRGHREPRGGRALRPEAGRRPPRRGDADVERGGRRHLPGRAAPTTCTCGACPSDPQQPRPTSATCRSTPRAAAHVRLGDVATVRVATDAQRRPPRGQLAPDRRRGQRRAVATSATIARRRPRPARGARRSRRATTPSCSARRSSARARSNRLLIFGIAGGARDLPAPAGGLRQHAPGAPVLPDPADGPRRRRARGGARPAARSRSARWSAS